MMSRNTPLSVLCGIVSVSILVLLLVTQDSPDCPKVDKRATIRTSEDDNNMYRIQRDNLSKLLNNMKQDYGKLNCDFNKMKGTALVTNTGGWCRADSSPNSTQHMTDRPFVTALANFFKGKKVGSFGDGPGMYKKLLDQTGLLAKYDAYDGAPFCEEVTGGAVKFLDLTAPQYGLPVYDWVMSLEVAEHIPNKYEHIYIDNIVRHAQEGFVLSWAVPTQGGHSHVNGKEFKDVKDRMEGLGFQVDDEWSKYLQQKATFPWLKANVYVYRRRHSKVLTKST